MKNNTAPVALTVNVSALLGAELKAAADELGTSTEALTSALIAGPLMDLLDERSNERGAVMALAQSQLEEYRRA